MRRLSTPKLFSILAVLLVALLATSDAVGARSIAPVERDKPRDLFDQMLHSLAAKYLPAIDPFSSSSGKSAQWSVHPLPRKRQLNLSPVYGGGGDDEGPTVSGLAGLTGGGGGNAIPASVLAAAASASTQTSTAVSTTPSVSASAAPASATGSSTTSQSPSSSTPSSSSSTPLSKLLTNPTTSSSSSSISSNVPPTSTNTSQRSTPSASLLSPKNKLFPLTVAGLACAGLISLMLLISIFRCIAHDQLRRDNLRKSYAFDDTLPATSSKTGRGDKFTAPAAGVGAARSLRRALTKKKLGSFARRTQEGSVLVEVGDEVFAVPAHLADGYREKVLRERREKMGGGMWGNVKPRHLNDGGPDEEEARAKYDAMLDGEDGGVKRTLSQRLGDRLRAFTSLPSVQEKGEGEKTFSFDTEGQTRGEMRQANLSNTGPAITTGGSAWTIRPSPIHQRTSSIPPPPPQVKQVSRKPAPKLSLTLLTEKLSDLEKQSSSSSSSSHNPPPTSSITSHNRPPSSAGTFGPTPSSSIPGAFPDRSKSLNRNRTVKPLLLAPEVGTYRHRSPAATRAKTQGHRSKGLERKPTSVPLASPTRFAPGRQLVVHPQTPPAAAIRPLPVPPPFNPKKSFT